MPQARTGWSALRIPDAPHSGHEMIRLEKAGLTYDGGTGITAPQAPAVPGTDTCSISGYSENDADPSGAGLTISFDDLAEGDV